MSKFLELMHITGTVLLVFSTVPAGLMMLFMTTREMKAEAIWIKPFLTMVGFGCVCIGLNQVLPAIIEISWFSDVMQFITGMICFVGMICISFYRREILGHFQAGPSKLLGGKGESYFTPRASDCAECVGLLEKQVKDMRNGSTKRKR